MVRLILMSTLLLGTGCPKKATSSGETAQVGMKAHPSIPKELAARINTTISLLEQGKLQEVLETTPHPEDLQKILSEPGGMEALLRDFTPKAESLLRALKVAIETEGERRDDDVVFKLDEAGFSRMVWSLHDGQWYLRN